MIKIYRNYIYYLIFLLLFYVNITNIYLHNNFIFKKIILNKNNLSKMFKNSVNLYNQMINNINVEYINLNNKNGKLKVIVVLLNYIEIKPFIDRNIIFLSQKYHDKLIFFVTENKTFGKEYRNITYKIVDVSNFFFHFHINSIIHIIIQVIEKEGNGIINICVDFFLGIYFFIHLYQM